MGLLLPIVVILFSEKPTTLLDWSRGVEKKFIPNTDSSIIECMIIPNSIFLFFGSN